MSEKEFGTHYFCVCEQEFTKKSFIRKHVDTCNYAQNKGNQCLINFGKKDMLQLAISNCEIQPLVDNQKVQEIQLNERFKCGCGKSFQSKGGYYRHIKKCKLRPEQQVVSGKTKCNEPGCLLTFKYIRDFRQHLKDAHKMKFDVEDKQFNRYSGKLNFYIN